MTYEIVTATAAARPIAAVRRQVPIGNVSTAWRPALDQVWAFLRRHEGLRTFGHNIFVYHHPTRSGDPMEVDFGVEVTGVFESEGEVVFANTPAGPVASTLHVGPIAMLGAANDAIESWCAAHKLELGGASWEIYGDPGTEDGTLEVRVFYLLA
jgi:effector-binding domain-containing protein